MTEAQAPAVRVLIPADRPEPARPPRDVVWSASGQGRELSWRVDYVPGLTSSRETVDQAAQAAAAALAALLDGSDPRGEVARFNAAPPGMY